MPQAENDRKLPLDGYLGATCERELQDAVVALALRNDRSVAAEVRRALRLHVERESFVSSPAEVPAVD